MTTQTTAKDFTISFSVDGQVSGTIQDLSLINDLEVIVSGETEVSELATAIKGKRVLRNDKSKKKEFSIVTVDVRGDTLVLKGSGTYEDRMKLPFGGWTKLYSQSGSVEVHVKIAASNGVPVVEITKVDIELSGILGDVMDALNIDKSIERMVGPIVQRTVNSEIRKKLPNDIGKIGDLYFEDLAFVDHGNGKFGARIKASAKIDLS